MRPPEYPKNGGSVEKTVREIIDYVRATTITGATGALLKQSRRGTTLAVPKPQVLPRTSTEASANHPFHLSVSKVDSLYYWSVSSVGSTITNGTNGASMTIANMDTDTAFTSAKYIVAQATVTSLVLGSITISAVDYPEEVDTSGTPVEQDTIRYLIGKVDVVDSAPTKTQYALTAARLTYGFLNAKLVRVFEFAPTHLG